MVNGSREVTTADHSIPTSTDVNPQAAFWGALGYGFLPFLSYSRAPPTEWTGHQGFLFCKRRDEQGRCLALAKFTFHFVGLSSKESKARLSFPTSQIMTYLQDSNIQVTSSQDVAKIFQDLLLLEDAIDQDKEHYYVMHLDTRSRIKLVELVSMGTLTSSLVHPRETFRRAVIAGTASIIVAHNHPSGEVDPSEEDTKVTRVLHDAGNILGISLLDHIVFAKGKFFSFKENREHTIMCRGVHLRRNLGL